MTYEQAHQEYLAQQQRYEALSEKDMKFFDEIRGVDAGRYDMKTKEWQKIAELYNNNALNAGTVFFNFGFLKGQRMAKAQMKRKEKAHK